MKSYSSREVIKIIEANGWYEVRCEGSHHHFRHPQRAGTVTVPHPRKDLKPNTIRSIFQQAGIEI